MGEILTYGVVMILVAFAVALLFALSIRGVRQAHYDVTAALFLLLAFHCSAAVYCSSSSRCLSSASTPAQTTWHP